jgi:hypothetical protein
LYKPETIGLVPGIDTIGQGLEHLDAGITLTDPLLYFEVTSDLDNDQIGRYTIRYDIFYELQIIDTRYRIIHVITQVPKLEITFHPDVTTLKTGDVYQDAGVSVSQGTLTVSGEVNTQVPGIYLLTYTVTYQSLIIEKTKIIHILGDAEYFARPVLFIVDKKGVWFR